MPRKETLGGRIGAPFTAPVGPKGRRDVCDIRPVLDSDGAPTGRWVAVDLHCGGIDVTARTLACGREITTRGGFSSAQDAAGARSFNLTADQLGAAWRAETRTLVGHLRHLATPKKAAPRPELTPVADYFEALVDAVGLQS